MSTLTSLTGLMVAAALEAASKHDTVATVIEAAVDWALGKVTHAELVAALDASAVRRVKAEKAALDEIAFGADGDTGD